MRPTALLILLFGFVSPSPASAQEVEPSPLADPRAPRTAIAVLHSDLVTNPDAPRAHGRISDTYASVRYGAVIPLAYTTRGTTRIGADLETMVGSRFRVRERAGGHLDFDNSNNDWTVGVAGHVTLRTTRFTLRAYHRSAHLGDDMFTYDGMEADEVPEERAELRWDQAWSPGLRTYLGGEVFWGDDRSPIAAPRRRLHAGAEVTRRVSSTVQAVAGADFYGAPGALRLSAAAGIRFRWFGRGCALVARRVEGPSLMGQFEGRRERWWGVEASMR